jgi:hypothetical protein
VELFEKGSAALNRLLYRFEKIRVYFINRFKFALYNPELREDREKDRQWQQQWRQSRDNFANGEHCDFNKLRKVALRPIQVTRNKPVYLGSEYRSYLDPHQSGIFHQNRFNRYNTG